MIGVGHLPGSVTSVRKPIYETHWSNFWLWSKRRLSSHLPSIGAGEFSKLPHGVNMGVCTTNVHDVLVVVPGLWHMPER